MTKAKRWEEKLQYCEDAEEDAPMEAKDEEWDARIKAAQEAAGKVRLRSETMALAAQPSARRLRMVEPVPAGPGIVAESQQLETKVQPQEQGSAGREAAQEEEPPPLPSHRSSGRPGQS